MASTPEFVRYVCEQIAGAGAVRYRKMFGEYLIYVDENHSQMVAKVCYEIGNRHAPLFYGSDPLSFVTPYNEPMLLMLQKLHGVSVIKAHMTLDFDKRISASIHTHQH